MSLCRIEKNKNEETIEVSARELGFGLIKQYSIAVERKCGGRVRFQRNKHPLIYTLVMNLLIEIYYISENFNSRSVPLFTAMEPKVIQSGT